MSDQEKQGEVLMEEDDGIYTVEDLMKTMGDSTEACEEDQNDDLKNKLSSLTKGPNEQEIHLGNEINDILIDQFLDEISADISLPFAINIKTKLKRFSVKLGKDFLEFPNFLGLLREIKKVGMLSSVEAFLTMVDNLPVYMICANGFFKDLMEIKSADESKSIYAALRAVESLEPTNWLEARLYLNLFKATDFKTTENAVLLSEKMVVRTPLYDEPFFNLAKYTNEGTLLKFIKLVEYSHLSEFSILQEIDQLNKMMERGDFAAIDQFLLSILFVYEGYVSSYSA